MTIYQYWEGHGKGETGVRLRQPCGHTLLDAVGGSAEIIPAATFLASQFCSERTERP